MRSNRGMRVEHLAIGLSLSFALSCSSQAPVRPQSRGTVTNVENQGGGEGNSTGSSGTSTSGSTQNSSGGSTSSSGTLGSSETAASGISNNTNGTGTTGTGTTTSNVKYSLLFIGGGSAKIDVYKFDKASGNTVFLSSMSLPGSTPSYLAIHAKKKLLFAVDESNDSIKSFAIDAAAGKLTALGDVSMAGGPAHLAVDSAGAYVYAASYGSGHVRSFAVQSNGSLAAAKSDVLAGMNAHQTFVSPTGAQLLVPCLGSNYIAQYNLSNGVLTAAGTVAVGNGGPRHIAFHPNGKWSYLMNEVDSTVLSLSYEASLLKVNGTAISSLTAPVAGNTGAEIQVHPNGKFVYSSNRGDDSIATYSVADTGRLTLIKTSKTGGTIPRHFALDSTGAWMSVANQTGGVTIFSVNASTGELTAKGTALNFDTAQFAEIVDFTD